MIQKERPLREANRFPYLNAASSFVKSVSSLESEMIWIFLTPNFKTDAEKLKRNSLPPVLQTKGNLKHQDLNFT